VLRCCWTACSMFGMPAMLRCCWTDNRHGHGFLCTYHGNHRETSRRTVLRTLRFPLDPHVICFAVPPWQLFRRQGSVPWQRAFGSMCTRQTPACEHTPFKPRMAPCTWPDAMRLVLAAEQKVALP
jgi:hypothetical protein